MSCGRCRREPKRLPYGYKATTYCICDTSTVAYVSKKSERQKARKEIAEARRGQDKTRKK